MSSSRSIAPPTGTGDNSNDAAVPEDLGEEQALAKALEALDPNMAIALSHLSKQLASFKKEIKSDLTDMRCDFGRQLDHTRKLYT
ncbi:hypothetical protein CAOG_009737 [Capsaspora owczarzaki ATCC 30864]|uniref:Uncharacterized protein n=1 Tax=Capsaspora owczarzaki (strain ATCC 30864) TaxID=595528 RepID=A0A0D2VQX8_CAPO3|nr:hypothetical protein CAOG_009737 [Capsaspora owczarzaki ATCC 30864]